MQIIKRLGLTLFLSLLAIQFAGCSDEGDPVVAPAVEEPVSFAADIQPIFTANCVGCHGLDGNAGLDLRAGQARLNLVDVDATTAAGKRVVTGSAATSILHRKMSGMEGGVMPPSGALPDATLDLIAEWINDGALAN